jgi:hypothetical protein
LILAQTCIPARLCRFRLSSSSATVKPKKAGIRGFDRRLNSKQPIQPGSLDITCVDPTPEKCVKAAYFTYGPYDRISEMRLKDANGQVLTKFGYDYNSPNSSVSALVQGNLANFATATIGAGSRITEQRFANGLGLNYTYDARLRIQNRTATINGGLLQTHNYTKVSGSPISGS